MKFIYASLILFSSLSIYSASIYGASSGKTPSYEAGKQGAEETGAPEKRIKAFIKKLKGTIDQESSKEKGEQAIFFNKDEEDGSYQICMPKPEKFLQAFVKYCCDHNFPLKKGMKKESLVRQLNFHGFKKVDKLGTKDQNWVYRHSQNCFTPNGESLYKIERVSGSHSQQSRQLQEQGQKITKLRGRCNTLEGRCNTLEGGRASQAEEIAALRVTMQNYGYLLSLLTEKDSSLGRRKRKSSVPAPVSKAHCDGALENSGQRKPVSRRFNPSSGLSLQQTPLPSSSLGLNDPDSDGYFPQARKRTSMGKKNAVQSQKKPARLDYSKLSLDELLAVPDSVLDSAPDSNPSSPESDAHDENENEEFDWDSFDPDSLEI